MVLGMISICGTSRRGQCEERIMAPSCLSRLPLFCLLLILSNPCASASPLILDIRDEVQQRKIATCNSTIQGRHLRSDDRGYVCKIMDVHAVTGCCPESDEQYSCWGCNMGSQCCNGYEYCVACCLSPMRTPNQIALNTKVARQLTAGTSTNVFDYCQGRCRHNSGSVVHENAYVSEDHHCFSPQDNSADPGPAKGDTGFDDLTIVIGRQGQSCDAACNGRGKTCKLSVLSALSNCQNLRKYLNCKEACVASARPEQPAEVVSTAPRHMHPGACLYSLSQDSFSCEASHPYSRRLCPCK